MKFEKALTYEQKVFLRSQLYVGRDVSNDRTIEYLSLDCLSVKLKEDDRIFHLGEIDVYYTYWPEGEQLSDHDCVCVYDCGFFEGEEDEHVFWGS